MDETEIIQEYDPVPNRVQMVLHVAAAIDRVQDSVSKARLKSVMDLLVSEMTRWMDEEEPNKAELVVFPGGRDE